MAVQITRTQLHNSLWAILASIQQRDSTDWEVHLIMMVIHEEQNVSLRADRVLDTHDQQGLYNLLITLHTTLRDEHQRIVTSNTGTTITWNYMAGQRYFQEFGPE